MILKSQHITIFQVHDCHSQIVNTSVLQRTNCESSTFRPQRCFASSAVQTTKLRKERTQKLQNAPPGQIKFENEGIVKKGSTVNNVVNTQTLNKTDLLQSSIKNAQKIKQNNNLKNIGDGDEEDRNILANIAPIIKTLKKLKPQIADNDNHQQTISNNVTLKDEEITFIFSNVRVFRNFYDQFVEQITTLPDYQHSTFNYNMSVDNSNVDKSLKSTYCNIIKEHSLFYEFMIKRIDPKFHAQFHSILIIYYLKKNKFKQFLYFFSKQLSDPQKSLLLPAAWNRIVIYYSKNIMYKLPYASFAYEGFLSNPLFYLSQNLSNSPINQNNQISNHGDDDNKNNNKNNGDSDNENNNTYSVKTFIESTNNVLHISTIQFFYEQLITSYIDRREVNFSDLIHRTLFVLSTPQFLNSTKHQSNDDNLTDDDDFEERHIINNKHKIRKSPYRHPPIAIKSAPKRDLRSELIEFIVEKIHMRLESLLSAVHCEPFKQLQPRHRHLHSSDSFHDDNIDNDTKLSNFHLNLNSVIVYISSLLEPPSPVMSSPPLHHHQRSTQVNHLSVNTNMKNVSFSPNQCIVVSSSHLQMILNLLTIADTPIKHILSQSSPLHLHIHPRSSNRNIFSSESNLFIHKNEATNNNNNNNNNNNDLKNKNDINSGSISIPDLVFKLYRKLINSTSNKNNDNNNSNNSSNIAPQGFELLHDRTREGLVYYMYTKFNANFAFTLLKKLISSSPTYFPSSAFVLFLTSQIYERRTEGWEEVILSHLHSLLPQLLLPSPYLYHLIFLAISHNLKHANKLLPIMTDLRDRSVQLTIPSVVLILKLCILAPISTSERDEIFGILHSSSILDFAFSFPSSFFEYYYRHYFGEDDRSSLEIPKCFDSEAWINKSLPYHHHHHHHRIQHRHVTSTRTNLNFSINDNVICEEEKEGEEKEEEAYFLNLPTSTHNKNYSDDDDIKLHNLMRLYCVETNLFKFAFDHRSEISSDVVDFLIGMMKELEDHQFLPSLTDYYYLLSLSQFFKLENEFCSQKLQLLSPIVNLSQFHNLPPSASSWNYYFSASSPSHLSRQ